MRFFVSEIVREKILKIYQKEVPYSCEVVVEEYKEDEKIVRIRANIMVSRTSQKSIVIGHQGKKIKKLGIESRIDIESFISKKVHLELFVKVDKDWRDKEGKLKKYGY
jgi:GTP-binding protein Era